MRKSFTLIELLVVVAIIAVLIALLLPAMALIQARVRLIFCQNNLKQLYVGFMGYSNDFAGRLPPCSGWGEGCHWESGYGFVNTLYRHPTYYMNDPKVFFCPDSILTDKRTPNANFPYQDSNYYYKYQMLGRNDKYKIDRTPPFSFIADVYTSGGTVFEQFNHVRLRAYNGLISDGRIVTIYGPLYGWCGNSPEEERPDIGIYWYIYLDRAIR